MLLLGEEVTTQTWPQYPKKMVQSVLLSCKYNNEISLMENALSDLFCTDYSSITLGKKAIPQ